VRSWSKFCYTLLKFAAALLPHKFKTIIFGSDMSFGTEQKTQVISFPTCYDDCGRGPEHLCAECEDELTILPRSAFARWSYTIAKKLKTIDLRNGVLTLQKGNNI